MSLRIGDVAPDFLANTTEGDIKFHQWIDKNWVMLFSHPKDFTPVCTTEIGCAARLQPEFEKRGCKIIGHSIDTVDDHLIWKDDIEQTQHVKLNFPLIGDPQLDIAKRYGMIHPNAIASGFGRTAKDNFTIRSLFIIDPEKKIQAIMTYPMSTGRNFHEVLRVLDSCQLACQHQVATPSDWQYGEDVFINPMMSDEDASKAFPQGWDAPKPYLRMVKQPK